ncbi:MDR family oxidoreductase [Subtercola sp. RTI3]|uniref:MDR family oxidoreductase n=1 Tax=Subtercola sp. RTI3 TaxID=3048639 RepID=UPI002B23892C|nr:MDR family oxidoreductase [Subtercola sp. RTI3]MEA9986128.1 MDR family oxidoreductase [Subtercola sp. RTI3]
MFRSIVVTEDTPAEPGTAELRTVDDDFLQPGAVTIAVEYSSVNYKDGLALAGSRGVVRSFPLIPGIDLVGTVVSVDEGGATSQASARFAPGDHVILNGDGIGEKFFGGFSERARVRPDALVKLPAGLTAKRAAAIGTAGFTAMIGVLALEKLGIQPSSGEILVTGAAGGVGSVAIALLAGRGYSVTASTGRADTEGDYLRSLGATTLLNRSELADPGKPLQKQRWAGAIDSVGSTTLANIVAQTNYGGSVVSCGLAQGADLPLSVMPFILRGVTLTGANSVEAPIALREEAWAALAAELDPALLDSMTNTIGLTDVLGPAGAGSRILAGSVRGRTVVDVRA